MACFYCRHTQKMLLSSRHSKVMAVGPIGPTDKQQNPYYLYICQFTAKIVIKKMRSKKSKEKNKNKLPTEDQTKPKSSQLSHSCCYCQMVSNISLILLKNKMNPWHFVYFKHTLQLQPFHHPCHLIISWSLCQLHTHSSNKAVNTQISTFELLFTNHLNINPPNSHPLTVCYPK